MNTKLPSSPETERALLGAVLLDESRLDELLVSLSADDLYLDANRTLFRRMGELRSSGSPIDALTLTEILRCNGELERVGGVAYLSSLLDSAIEHPSLEPYIKIVRSKAIMRGIYTMASAAMEEAQSRDGNPESLLEKIEHYVLSTADETVDKGFSTIADSVTASGGLDDYLETVLAPVSRTGIPLGYENVDRIIGGLEREKFYVVAARPSHGKSALVGNLCDNILQADPSRVIALFALEMSKESVLTRLLSAAAHVDIRKAKYWQPTLNDRVDLTRALERLIDKQLFIDDSSYLTPVRLRSKCRQLQRRAGRLDLVIIDFLQLMVGGQKFESREKEVSAVSRSMKALAKEVHCPVIAVAALSRNVEGRQDKTPILADLRESGSIESDADVVIFIHRPELYDSDPDLKGIAEITVAKNRDGATGRCKLVFMPQYTRFENLALD